MSEPIERRGMSGKDVITVGIFSAIYFVINFVFMLPVSYTHLRAQRH